MTAETHTVLHVHVPPGVEGKAPGYGWQCSCRACSYGWGSMLAASNSGYAHRTEALAAQVAEMQARLDARAADLGRMTQAGLGRIKSLEAGCAALARMQEAVAKHRQQLQQVGHATPEGREATGALCLALIDAVAASPRMYVTRAGTVLTDTDLEGLVAEAERGYCTWGTGLATMCGKPVPCPEHPAP